MLKFVLPSENELLLTYSIIDVEYLGAMAKYDIEKPIAAVRIPDIAIIHTRFHRYFKI